MNTSEYYNPPANEYENYFKQRFLDDDVGVERIQILESIVNIAKSTIPNFIKLRLNLNNVITLPSANQTMKAIGKINRLSGFDAENITVFMPDGTSGVFQDYLKALTDVYYTIVGDAPYSKSLLTNSVLINSTGSPLMMVVDGLITWSANIVNDPSYIGQSWGLTGESIVDTERGVKEIKKFYNPAFKNRVGVVSLNSAYPKGGESIREVDTIFNTVGIRLNQDLQYDWTTKLNTLSESLDRAIVVIQKILNSNTDNKALLKKTEMINDLILHTAKCIELLSVVMYQLKVSSVSYFNTIKKINDTL